MTTKRITKRQADYFRGNVPGILAMLYNNIVGHVGYDISEDEIIAFARERLAKFKVPRTVVFTDLPKTSTGKIQKFVLRERAKVL